MLFNSPEFIFCFLPIVIAGFAILGLLGRNAVVSWLALASVAFYAYWRPPFVLLLVGSILVNFLCSRLIWRTRDRPSVSTAILVLGIVANLSALAFFKYLFPFLNFLNATLNLHHSFGNVILPLGISFFTFTQIAYLVDLAQDEAAPQDLISYVLFVTFFPHLIAGPILHHKEIMPQFAAGRRFSLQWDDVSLGITWFALGLCKKVLIADHLAPNADTAFSHVGNLSTASAWLGVLNYSLQLYFDFSGYSDMALGLARIFSIRLPINFDSPYQARNIIELWSRWHMTLTRYLTLYLYNPISMWINRRRLARGMPVSRKATKTAAGFFSLIAFPTIATMFLAGIWHGAGTQFIIFGMLHGVYLTINHAWRLFRKDGSISARLMSNPVICIGLTYAAVLIGQIFFRADSTSDAGRLIIEMCGLGTVNPAAATATFTSHVYAVFLLFPVVWFLPNTQEILGQTKQIRRNLLSGVSLALWRPNWTWAIGISMGLIASLWYMTDTSSFLYFQF